MNYALIWRLMIKDWYLSRASLALIAVGGGFSISLLYLRTEVGGFLGLTSSLIALIFLSILLPQQTVVNERKRQNLAFVMSLPISPAEYTAAKVLGNLAAFVVVWLAIAGGVLGTIGGAFGGLIPMTIVAALAPFAAFCLMLMVAIVLESELWTMVTMGILNVSYSFAWFFLIRLPEVRESLQSPVALWVDPLQRLLLVECAVIVLTLGLTFFFQSRKTDFV